MKMRTLSMIGASFAYILLLLPLTRVRAQARPAAPEPASVAVPAMAAVPAMPAAPAIPAVPAVPIMPALPAEPAVPAEPFAPAWESGHAWGSTHWGDGPAADCSDLHIRLNDERPTIESEERTVSKGEASVLRVHEIENGGVQARGWDKDTYSVTACKAAVGGDAARLLSQIKLAVQGGEVSVSGPHGERNDWTVFLLIRTPRSADIEVTAHNGPVSFYSVDGKITTRATNGPISLKDCSGEANISAQNGPISFSGTSGKLRLHTQNGPISVAGRELGWFGAGCRCGEWTADAARAVWVQVELPGGVERAFAD